MALPVYSDERSKIRGGFSLRVEMTFFAVGFLCSWVILIYMAIRLWVSPPELRNLGALDWLAGPAHWILPIAAVFFGCKGTAFIGLSFLARRDQLRQARLDSPCSPYVSILVPCFNEGETIAPAMESLLELDYPSYEILVINDGSTDDTLRKAKQYEGRFGGVTVRVFDKPNGGKWSALNLGFHRSSGEFLLCVDADSRLEPGSLRRMVNRLRSPRVAAVAGQVRVRNRHNLITLLQSLEYQMGNGAVRMGQSYFGTILVIAGALGLFRRSAMEEVLLRNIKDPCGNPGAASGPYEGNTFAEDFDLSLSMLSLGGRIVYEPLAVSFTTAPDRVSSLISQRYRWLRGSFQVLYKFFRRAKSGKETSPPGRVWAWLLLTYLPDLALTPILYVVGTMMFLVLTAMSGSILTLAAFAAVLMLVQACVGAFFLTMHRDTLRLLKVLPFLDAYLGILLGSAWLISVVDEFRGAKMRW